MRIRSVAFTMATVSPIDTDCVTVVTAMPGDGKHDDCVPSAHNGCAKMPVVAIGSNSIDVAKDVVTNGNSMSSEHEVSRNFSNTINCTVVCMFNVRDSFCVLLARNALKLRLLLMKTSHKAT